MKRQYNEITTLINQYIAAINLLKFWTEDESKILKYDSLWTQKYSPEKMNRLLYNRNLRGQFKSKADE